MSVHSCNELCDLDEKFHSIQKHEGPNESWSTDKKGMRKFIHEKIGEYYELLRKLE